MNFLQKQEAERAFSRLLNERYGDVTFLEEFDYDPYPWYRDQTLGDVLAVIGSISFFIASIASVVIGMGWLTLIPPLLLIYSLVCVFKTSQVNNGLFNYSRIQIAVKKEYSLKLYRVWGYSYEYLYGIEKEVPMSFYELSQYYNGMDLADLLKPLDREADRIRALALKRKALDDKACNPLHQMLAYEDLKLEGAEELVRRNEAAREVDRLMSS